MLFRGNIICEEVRENSENIFLFFFWEQKITKTYLAPPSGQIKLMQLSQSSAQG